MSTGRAIPFDAFFPLPFRVLFLAGMGMLGWATNLHGLELSGVDVVTAMDLRTPEGTGKLSLPSHRPNRISTHYLPIYRLFTAYSVCCFGAWALFIYLIHGDLMLVDAFRYIPAICGLWVVIVLISEFNVFQKRERDMFLSTIQRCLFSPSDQPVYFSDVVFADIFTSFAKVLGDVWLSICMLLPGGSFLVIPRQEGWSRWILPTIMSLPYLARFRQCIIEYRLPANTSRRPLYNAIKYATSFPVIYLSAALRIVPEIVEESGGKFTQDSWQGGLRLFRLWLFAAAMNSLYSFWWDVTNDWGLDLLNPSSSKKSRGRPASPLRRLVLPELHRASSSSLRPPSPSRRGSSEDTYNLLSTRGAYPYGLRSLLLYPVIVYPLFIFLNLILRMTWSIKLSSHLHSDPDGTAVIFWLEIAELVRRWMWVFLRVEWEVVRKVQAVDDRESAVGDSQGFELLGQEDEEGVGEMAKMGIESAMSSRIGREATL